jgi:phosphoribosylformylglycinamidine synthase
MSGNVSFYNESVETSVPPTPEIMGIGIVPDIRKCVTSDFKSEGNLIYLVGKETEKEMGGSEYYNIMNIDGGTVPKSEIKLLKNSMKGILSAIDKQTIASCHDISEGGLGVCISEMCIGGNLGCEIDLTNIGKDLRSDIKLFSESNTRWIVEVKKHKEKEFENTLRNTKTPFIKIGLIKKDRVIVGDIDSKVINQKIDILQDIWKKAIWSFMG